MKKTRGRVPGRVLFFLDIVWSLKRVTQWTLLWVFLWDVYSKNVIIHNISCTLPLSHFIIAFYDIISHILWLYRKQYNDFISFQWALPLISLQRKRSRWVPLFYKQELFIVMLGNKKMASKKKRQSLFKDVKLTRPQLKQLEFLKNLILIGKNTLCEDLSLL